MKAVIELDVPDWQIGQEVSVYFPDTMCKKGKCEPSKIIRCKDCKHWDSDDHDCNIKTGWFACGADWYCADGELEV